MPRFWFPVISSIIVCVACSKTPCHHLADSSANLVSKATPCAQGGALSFSVPQVNINQCNQACSQIDQTALDQLASCFDSVPECDPSSPQSFEAAVTPCATDVANIGSECLASLAVTTSHGAPADGGTTSQGGDGCHQFINAALALNPKLTPCVDGGTASMSMVDMALTNCEQHCTSNDQVALAASATCLNAVPACTPSSESMFGDDLNKCVQNLQLSAPCQQAINLGTTGSP